MEQKDAIKKLATQARDNGALIVSEIGSQPVWLHDGGDHASHLYLSGPMGMAPSVALGVALSKPKTPVLALCGDGALAMNLTALVTIAHQAPPNLTLAVMNNGIYDFTGAVPSPSTAINWQHIITGLPNFEHFAEFDANTTVQFAADKGLGFIECMVRPATEKAKPFPFTAPEIYARFLKYVQAE